MHQDSLPGLFTADLLSTDILVKGEETIEEYCQAYQGCREEPACVESWGIRFRVRVWFWIKIRIWIQIKIRTRFWIYIWIRIRI